jgi:hypothetical protein
VVSEVLLETTEAGIVPVVKFAEANVRVSVSLTAVVPLSVTVMEFVGE